MKKKFDTKVQHHKYKVLREVARNAWNDTIEDAVYEIPKKIISKKEDVSRCCVYKERAIAAERVKMAMGGHSENPNVIEVIDIACDECPESGYDVSDACRGCMAHRCEDACRLGAITHDENHKAHIDKSKCVNCGACAKVCPYQAIINRTRPCENSCKVKAIHMGETGEATIDNDKCISCGSCVFHCPFGAINDKSFILDAIDIIKKSENNTDYKVYAVVAPSVAGQFTYAKLGQIIEAIHQLGFYDVVEAALGADMVAKEEAKELAECETFLTSSCCPAFVDYVYKFFPQLVGNVSTNLSPMAVMGRHLKSLDPDSKVIFIGPCTAKKMEYKKDTVSPYIDCVLTFEELQALFDSRDFEVENFEERAFNGASYFGRIFARSGGLSEAIAQGLRENGNEDFNYSPIACNGIEECKIALLKASKGVLPNNFIEGMSCVGGCIGGAGCLTHAVKTKVEVESYGRDSENKTIADALGNN